MTAMTCDHGDGGDLSRLTAECFFP